MFVGRHGMLRGGTRYALKATKPAASGASICVAAASSSAAFARPTGGRCISTLVGGKEQDRRLIATPIKQPIWTLDHQHTGSAHTTSVSSLLSQTRSLVQTSTGQTSPPSSARGPPKATTPSHLGKFEPQKMTNKILTIPNMLTILRLTATPFLGTLILVDAMPQALMLLAVMGFSDVLDGFIARRYNMTSVFGSIADPAADKAMMLTIAGALAWRGLIPAPLVFLIIGRDVALILSALKIRWSTLPAPKTMKRFWDPQVSSAMVVPTQVSKINTFLQIVLVGLCTLLAALSNPWRTWWSDRQGFWTDRSVERSNARVIAPDQETLDLRKFEEELKWELIKKHGGAGTNKVAYWMADAETHKARLKADAKRRQEEATMWAEEAKRAPRVGSDRIDWWGDSSKKAFHGFMFIVAGTTVWSGASYLFGSAGFRQVGRAASRAQSATKAAPQAPFVKKRKPLGP